MKRKVRILELARVGKWGLDGSEITKRDIAELAETTKDKRPVVIGHGVTDRAPKFGDVLDCWPSKDGCALVGCVSFSEAADKLFEDGAYDGWSISRPRRSTDGKRVLHHLAILGAVPPKIPGLAELAKMDCFFGDGGGEGAKDMYQFSGRFKPEEEGNGTMTEQKKGVGRKGREDRGTGSQEQSLGRTSRGREERGGERASGGNGKQAARRGNLSCPVVDRLKEGVGHDSN